MPRSRSRKKDVSFDALVERRPAAISLPSRWVAPTMVALLILGLTWVVVWYIAGNDIPGMRDWGVWNLVGGFAFIFAGLMVATRWR